MCNRSDRKVSACFWVFLSTNNNSKTLNNNIFLNYVRCKCVYAACKARIFLVHDKEINIDREQKLLITTVHFAKSKKKIAWFLVSIYPTDSSQRHYTNNNYFKDINYEIYLFALSRLAFSEKKGVVSNR